MAGIRYEGKSAKKLLEISTREKATVQAIRCAHKPFTVIFSRLFRKHLLFAASLFMPQLCLLKTKEEFLSQPLLVVFRTHTIQAQNILSFVLHYGNFFAADFTLASYRPILLSARL